MSKSSTVFICESCGYECGKWLGKCPSCGEWNTLNEHVAVKQKSATVITDQVQAIPLCNVEQSSHSRFSTGINELDNVLGGGIVPASLVLLGGDPGIGKSTLLLQLASNVSNNARVLYASAEESAQQVKLRAQRLDAAKNQELLMLAQTELGSIIDQIEKIKPALAIVDSIQTVYSSSVQGVQGSVSQVRECTAQLMKYAKSSGVAIILVGHVTKEGAIAGPKVLEHLVDTVLYFEGEKNSNFRILRAVKNRFGASNEIGIFQMTDKGMLPVGDPSKTLLSADNRAPGNAVLCTVEGTRPILCDVQALVCQTAFAVPRRSSNGFDYNRTAMLLAVLEKRLGYTLYNKDVYLNVAGGMRLDDPAADLALLAAVASAVRDRAISHDTVLIGEVGLTGELRNVSNISARVAECKKLGKKRIIVPKATKKELEAFKDVDIIFADSLESALKKCFDKDKKDFKQSDQKSDQKSSDKTQNDKNLKVKE